MTERNVHLGTAREPMQAGNPLRIDVTALIAVGGSSPPGSLSPLDLTVNQGISYALFRMIGDLPATSPTFVLDNSSGDIVVSSPEGGRFSIFVSQSMSALWSGLDWHVCRARDYLGQPFDIFDGIVVSTRALAGF